MKAKKDSKGVPLSELVDFERFMKSFDSEKARKEIEEYLAKYSSDISQV